VTTAILPVSRAWIAPTAEMKTAAGLTSLPPLDAFGDGIDP
jgi:hypothetical protein